MLQQLQWMHEEEERTRNWQKERMRLEEEKRQREESERTEKERRRLEEVRRQREKKEREENERKERIRRLEEERRQREQKEREDFILKQKDKFKNCLYSPQNKDVPAPMEFDKAFQSLSCPPGASFSESSFSEYERSVFHEVIAPYCPGSPDGMNCFYDAICFLISNVPDIKPTSSSYLLFQTSSSSYPLFTLSLATLLQSPNEATYCELVDMIGSLSVSEGAYSVDAFEANLTTIFPYSYVQESLLTTLSNNLFRKRLLPLSLIYYLNVDGKYLCQVMLQRMEAIPTPISALSILVFAANFRPCLDLEFIYLVFNKACELFEKNVTFVITTTSHPALSQPFLLITMLLLHDMFEIMPKRKDVISRLLKVNEVLHNKKSPVCLCETMKELISTKFIFDTEIPPSSCPKVVKNIVMYTDQSSGLTVIENRKVETGDRGGRDSGGRGGRFWR